MPHKCSKRKFGHHLDLLVALLTILAKNPQQHNFVENTNVNVEERVYCRDFKRYHQKNKPSNFEKDIAGKVRLSATGGKRAQFNIPIPNCKKSKSQSKRYYIDG